MTTGKFKIPQSLKHSIWSILDAAIYPAVYLATMPLMIKGLGMINFGLWILLSSLITILQLFNINSGVGNTGTVIIRQVAYALANQDHEHLNNIINSILHITLGLFILITGIGFLLSMVAVPNKWWGFSDIPQVNVSMCILLASLIAGLKYFDQVFQTVIRAFERFKMSSILNMIYRFGSLVITVSLAVNNCSIVNLLWANIAFLVLYLALQFVCIKWIIPGFKTGASSNRILYKNLFRFSIWPWLQSVVIVLTFQSDRFLVSSYLGIREVSGYGLVSTMFNHIHIIFTAMALWMLPRLSMMITKGEDPAKLYYWVRGAILSFITISLLLFNYISPLLIRFWVGANVSAFLLVYMKGFIAFEIVFAHSIMPFFYLNAAGKERLATLLTLLYCGICYILMLFGLLIFHNAVFMVMGMTLAMCVCMPVVNAVVQQKMYGSISIVKIVIEMLPMYAAILLLYAEKNVLLTIVLAISVALLLWKCYLSPIIKQKLWSQKPLV